MSKKKIVRSYAFFNVAKDRAFMWQSNDLGINLVSSKVIYSFSSLLVIHAWFYCDFTAGNMLLSICLDLGHCGYRVEEADTSFVYCIKATQGEAVYRLHFLWLASPETCPEWNDLSWRKRWNCFWVHFRSTSVTAMSILQFLPLLLPLTSTQSLQQGLKSRAGVRTWSYTPPFPQY